MDVLEEARQLFVEQGNVSTSEDLGDKVTAWPQHVQGNVQCLCRRR